MGDIVIFLVLAAIFAVITFSGWRLLKYEKWSGLARKMVGIPIMIFGGLMTLFFILAAFVPKTPEQIAAEKVRAEQAAKEERQKIAAEKKAEADRLQKVTDEKAAIATKEREEEAKLKAEQEKEKRENAVIEKAENVALTGGALLKRSMNDPDSLEFISVKVKGDGSFCARYRGKNAFGALVINELSVLGEKTYQDWKNGCDKEGMLDFTDTVKSLNQSGLLSRLADKLPS